MIESAYERVSKNLEKACDEIIALKRERDKAVRMLASTPPALDAAREEAEELQREIQRYQVLEMNATRELKGAKRALEDLAIECAFWKRAAAQAMRMWERVEDERDDLKKHLKLEDLCDRT